MKKNHCAIILLFAALWCAAVSSASAQESDTPGPEIAPAEGAASDQADAQEQREEYTPSLPAGASDEQISVATGYRGFALTVFGVNPDRRGRGDIVIIARGPRMPVRVFRWERDTSGLFWRPGQHVLFNEVTSFQGIYRSRPMRELATPQAIMRYDLEPIASAPLASPIPSDADTSVYRRALQEVYRSETRYVESEQQLTLYQGNLFRAKIQIPANAPYGQYQIDSYLFRDGRLIATERIPVTISRIGILRRADDLSANHPDVAVAVAALLAALYGLVLSIAARLAIGERLLPSLTLLAPRRKRRLVRGA